MSGYASRLFTSGAPSASTAVRDVTVEIVGGRVWWAPWRRHVMRHTFTSCLVVGHSDGRVDVARTRDTRSIVKKSTVAAWPWTREGAHDGKS